MVIVLLVLPGSFARGQSESTQKLIEGAKKEGKLLWYTALNVADADMLLRRFEQKFPFIKGELLRLGSPQLLTKILTESKAGAFRGDVIEIAGVLGHILKKEGLLAKYVSSEAHAYPASMRDADATWTSFFFNTHVLVYNTKMVKREELPRMYEDLLQSKWKRNIALRDDDFDNFGMMLRAMGRDKGLNFMRRLAAQAPELRKGSTLAVQLVAAGEVPLGMNLYGTRVEEFKKRGAPIDWAPMEFVIAAIEPLGVAARAGNPNSARLFVDFLLSKESQTLMRDRSRIPSRPDVAPDPPRLTQGLKLVPTDLSLADESKQLAKDFYDIFNAAQRN
jgi:iron(III) transport system substrate-binding protein